MDNFEYSIQISDRDWEEFYSTAEECGLMPVSLATEEELLLSDTEHEDTTCSTASVKPKFVRVSLCPPVGERREPQTMQVGFSPHRHSTYKWMGSSDDVLSGSEDEEEFGSVARFLCQKETLMSKVGTQYQTDIPSSKRKDNDEVNTTIEKPQERKNTKESLEEFIRYRNTRRKLHFEDREEIQVESPERMYPSVTFNGEAKKVNSNDNPNISRAFHEGSKSSPQFFYSEDLPEDNQSCNIIKDPFISKGELNGNIPGIGNTKEDAKIGHLSLTALQPSLGKHGIPTAKKEFDDSIDTNSTLHTLDSPDSAYSCHHANVIEYDTMDYMSPCISKALRDSSAVQQNIPASSVEVLDLFKTKTNLQEPDSNFPTSSHELSCIPYRLPSVEGTNPVYSLVPATISGHNVTSKSLTTHHHSPSYRSRPLTLPEMYDFFFDDVSESEIIEIGTNMASQESTQKPIVYTPDMYEYFFVEEAEKKIKINEKPDEPITNVEEDSPHSVASWPEAYEFFFADGPQQQDKKSVLYSVPSSQAERTPNFFQAIVPKELKDFKVRRVFHGRDRKPIPHEYHGTSEEANEPTTGSVVPCLSPSRSDACLVFLALASWAVKSQASEGWKTVLLANIGAVSAIRYLRRRRRTWQGPTLEPLEEI